MSNSILYTQEIPSNPFWDANHFPWILRKSDDKYFSICDSDERQVLRDALAQYFSSRQSTLIPWRNEYYSGYAGSYLVSLGTPPPEQTATYSIPRRKTSNAPFERKVQEGKIVVSDFQSEIKVDITARPKLTPISNEIQSIRTAYIDTFTDLAIKVPDPTGQGWSDCYRIGGITYRSGYVKIDVRETIGYYEPLNTDYDIHDHAHRVATNIVGAEMDGSIIVDCLADANDGSFDALTALAESVESYSSILSFIIEILQMYKDAKKGEIRLHNKLSRLRKVQQPSAQIRKEIKEVTSAIASVWLSYRLAISPTVSMIEDMLALDTSSERVYLRYRNGSDREINFSYGDENCFATMKHRAFIKRSYESWLSALGINPLRTIWELVPLSFVVDRYMRIGNAIASLSPNLSIQEGATYSWKVSADGLSGTWNDVNYTITASAYRRNVIQPSHYCGISYPDSRTVSQKLDHLALIWELFVKDFLFSKKGK